MTTMFKRKQRRNPSWLRVMARRIGVCRFYRALGRGWRESWDMAGRTI